MKFDVRYYLVAILFILFDLEIAFLFPWAVVLQDIGFEGFVAMMIFLLILIVGLRVRVEEGRARVGMTETLTWPSKAYSKRASSRRRSTA